MHICESTKGIEIKHAFLAFSDFHVCIWYGKNCLVKLFTLFLNEYNSHKTQFQNIYVVYIIQGVITSKSFFSK